MKIATWNVNSLRVRLDHVLAWLKSTEPDILALQETKLTDENFPVDAFENAGYHAVFSGQPTYNGVALISRQPAEEVVTEIDGLDDPQRRVLAATYGRTARHESVCAERAERRIGQVPVQARVARGAARAACERSGPLRAPHDIGGLQHRARRSRCSRSRGLGGQGALHGRRAGGVNWNLGLGFSDTFRLFEQPDKSYSWWDYRAGAFRRNMGMRIDLILASEGLSRVCAGSRIDVEPRRWERPSDHTPVVAEFTWF